MPNEIEGKLYEDDQAAAKRPWQTPDLEEVDVRETANGAPPNAPIGDGINGYS